MKNRTHGPAMLVLAAVLLAAMSTDSSAQEADPASKWALILDIGSLSPSGSGLSSEAGSVTSDLEFDTGVGAGFRLEYRFTDLLGAEFAVFSAARLDLESSVLPGSVESRARLGSITPVTAGLNVHLMRGRAPDLYVGVQLGVVRYGSIEVRATTGGETERISGDAEFAWGVSLGLGFPIGKHGWSLQGSLRYLDAGIKHSGTGPEVHGDVSPTIVTVGVGYAF